MTTLQELIVPTAVAVYCVIVANLVYALVQRLRGPRG